jgi:PGF-pre-PGF domain-containing protein
MYRESRVSGTGGIQKRICGTPRRLLSSTGYIFLVIVVLALAGPVAAVPVLTIDNSSADAIASNLSNVDAGGTLILNPGTYFETGLTIPQDITLRANTSYGGTAADTIIDGGSGVTGIMTVNAGVTMVIDNLTFQNVNGDGSSGNGGAINNAGTLTITSSTFSNCREGNYPNFYGGAIENTGILTITSSTFSGCNAVLGGAIDNSASATLIVTSSSFISCTGHLGVISNSGTATITSSTFTSCSTDQGGAIYNTAMITSISSTTFSGCTATTDMGGAIFNGGTITSISSTRFSGCSARLGGAIYNSGTITSISTTSFSGCSADQGGAIDNVGTITVTSSTFTGCSAHYSGGGLSGSGGAIYNEGTITSITTSSFTSCTAIYGGAIYNNGGTITSITTSSFTDCAANGFGNAIYNAGPITSLTFSTFNGCSANGRYAIYNSGTITAPDNWWGTNTPDFSNLIHGAPAPASWLVLGTSATPSSITSAQTSLINVNLTWDSNGIYHNPASGHVPDGIAVSFSSTSGTLAPVSGSMASGANATLFTPAGSGTSTITSTVDLQSVTVPVVVGTSGTSITGISPTGGRTIGGEMVTISGSGFTGASAVNFGANASPSYHVDLDTQITAVAPPNPVGTVDITVTTPGGTSPVVAADQFTYTNVPVVTGKSPSAGPATGSMVTITGIGFVGTTAVKFGTTPASWYSVDNDMQISAYYAPGIAGSTVHITVVTPESTSTTGPADLFTYSANPLIQHGDNSDNGPPTQSGASGSPTQSATSGTPATQTVNVGGNSGVTQVAVTGTGISGLIVTGTTATGPGQESPPPPGIVYQYMDITPARYASISGAVIFFTIPLSWLQDHTIDPRSIVLYHITPDGWVALPTTVLSTKSGAVFFSATSPGFSLFAIAGMAGSTASVSSATAQVTPGSENRDLTPEPSSVVRIPVTTQTTVPPANAPQPSASSPVMIVVLVIAAIAVLGAGGFVVRRWWIRRQNPALFREYD